jgi:hypothetical protein
MAIGMDRETGKLVDSTVHLKQSIRDILTTRIGTRVMLREYGSNIPELVDLPSNRSTIAAIRSDIISALNNWEPRCRVNKVTLTELSAGHVTFDLFLTYLPNGEEIALVGVTV